MTKLCIIKLPKYIIAFYSTETTTYYSLFSSMSGNFKFSTFSFLKRFKFKINIFLKSTPISESITIFLSPYFISFYILFILSIRSVPMADFSYFLSLFSNISSLRY